MDRVYSDGTPATGPAFPFEEVPTEEWLKLVHAKPTDRPRLPTNPSAAEVHRREAGAPWRRAGDEEVAADIRKAKPELWRKKITGLASQTCKGLQKAYGSAPDYTSFAAQLTDAFKVKAALKDAADRSGEGGPPPDLNEETRAALQLIDAVLKFDLPKLKDILEVHAIDKSDMELPC